MNSTHKGLRFHDHCLICGVKHSITALCDHRIYLYKGTNLHSSMRSLGNFFKKAFGSVKGYDFGRSQFNANEGYEEMYGDHVIRR